MLHDKPVPALQPRFSQRDSLRQPLQYESTDHVCWRTAKIYVQVATSERAKMHPREADIAGTRWQRVFSIFSLGMSHNRSYLSGLEGVKDLSVSGTQPRCTSLLDRLDLLLVKLGLVSGKHVQNVRWLEPSCTDLLRVIRAAALAEAIKACYEGLQVASISFPC